MKVKTKKVVIAVGIVAIIGVIVVLLHWKRWTWENQMSAIPRPEQTTLLYEDFLTAPGLGGSDDNLMYVYYWIISSHLSDEQLTEHYSAYVEEISNDFSGSETFAQVFAIDEHEIRNDEMQGVVSKHILEYGKGNKYVVLIQKPGRLYFWN